MDENQLYASIDEIFYELIEDNISDDVFEIENMIHNIPFDKFINYLYYLIKSDMDIKKEK